MSRSSPLLRLLLLAVACFALATVLQRRALTWSDRAQADNVLKVLFGDGRRLFASHFFTQADISFHSGYYPSIFDQARNNQKKTAMATAHDDHDDHDHDGDGKPDHAASEHKDDHDAHASGTNAPGSPAQAVQHHEESEHEKEMAFLREPKDWIEGFGRHFMVVEHTHLAQGQEREILPWLRLSAELDPQRIDTYTVAAYWLRGRMGKVKEAEEFLRDGLRANPQSSAILFELGKLYSENNHDTPRARGVWELALLRWQENEAKQKEPDTFLLNEIAMNLAHAEEEAGELDGAITHLGIALKNSPSPEMIAKEIAELKAKLAARPSP